MNLKDQHSSGGGTFYTLTDHCLLKKMQKSFLPRIWHIGTLQYILRLFVDSDKEQKFVKVAELVLSDFLRNICSN